MAKILIVEDESDISESIKMVIESMDHEAKKAENGEEAITILKEEDFDLVLLDMLMPGISGNEVAEWMRSNPKTKDMKFAFLTVVQLDESGIERDIIDRLNPAGYFQKPISAGELKEGIRKILG